MSAIRRYSRRFSSNGALYASQVAGWPAGQWFQPLDGWINSKIHLAGARFSICNEDQIASETEKMK